MSAKFVHSINLDNVVHMPRPNLENGQLDLSSGDQIHLNMNPRANSFQSQETSKKQIPFKHELSEDSESETERILLESTTHVGKFIEVNSKGGVTEVMSFDPDDPTNLLHPPEKNRPYECDICHKMFTRIEILRRHLKTHMADKEYKCTYCGKAFDRRDVMNDHMRNHTGEKPFQCTICLKKFTRGFVLLRHMKIHTDGAFKCKFCLKTFDRKDTFRDHVRNHTGERPFKCKFCNKSFSRSFVLTKHEKGHQQKVETVEEEDYQKAETILVEGIDYEEDVHGATEILLQKDFPQVVIEEATVEENIEEDFSLMNSHHLHSDTLVSEPIAEEVVESGPITLATSDGQLVRVITREQYDKLLEVASKSKTYKCDACNRRFTSSDTFQDHFTKLWEQGGCISNKVRR